MRFGNFGGARWTPARESGPGRAGLLRTPAFGVRPGLLLTPASLTPKMALRHVGPRSTPALGGCAGLSFWSLSTSRFRPRLSIHGVFACPKRQKNVKVAQMTGMSPPRSPYRPALLRKPRFPIHDIPAPACHCDSQRAPPAPGRPR